METTEPVKSVEEIAINIAGVCTDEFLSILSEWFHPDEKWDRIEKTAREFLVEAIIRETKKALHSYTASREKSERERVSQVIKERSAKSMSSKVPINCEPTELLLKAIYPSTSDVTTE